MYCKGNSQKCLSFATVYREQTAQKYQGYYGVLPEGNITHLGI